MHGSHGCGVCMQTKVGEARAQRPPLRPTGGIIKARARGVAPAFLRGQVATIHRILTQPDVVAMSTPTRKVSRQACMRRGVMAASMPLRAPTRGVRTRREVLGTRPLAMATGSADLGWAVKVLRAHTVQVVTIRQLVQLGRRAATAMLEGAAPWIPVPWIPVTPCASGIQEATLHQAALRRTVPGSMAPGSMEPFLQCRIATQTMTPMLCQVHLLKYCRQPRAFLTPRQTRSTQTENGLALRIHGVHAEACTHDTLSLASPTVCLQCSKQAAVPVHDQCRWRRSLMGLLSDSSHQLDERKQVLTGIVHPSVSGCPYLRAESRYRTYIYASLAYVSLNY